MAVATFEGIVEAGQIRLVNGERLPEQATVYVVVPGFADDKPAYAVTLPPSPHIASPRLADKKDAPHFAVRMTEGAAGAA